MDPEIGCQLSMEPLLYGAEAVLPESWSYGVSKQWIASKSNHPFVIKVTLSIHDMNGHKSFVSAYMTATFNTGSILINRALDNWFRSARDGPNTDILPSEALLGTEHSIIRIYEPQTPLDDEVSISQFVFGNPFGWGAAAVALVMMATVAFGIRASLRGLRDETSINRMV
jgi:hypothetical protein